jgi:FkbM family methyltransferase
MTAKLMVDLGAHKGATSRAYLEAGWRVVAVEAHPALSIMWPLRFHPGDCYLVHAAITPTGQPATLYVSNKGTDGETHSIYPHRVKGCEQTPYEVPGTTIAQLFTAHGVPDYLKIDIEGADVVAIRQLHEWERSSHHGFKGVPQVNLPKRLSVELDWDHPEEALEIFSHLGYMGYDRFDLVQQHWDEQDDIETLLYPYTIGMAAHAWFSTPKMQDVWYDLHARHKDATQ